MPDELNCLAKVDSSSALLPAALPAEFKISRTSDQATLTFRFNRFIPGVPEHFPNYEIAAGYMQLIWLEFLAVKAWPDYVLKEVIDIKFCAPITPDHDVQVQLRVEATSAPDSPCMRFDIKAGETICTKGRISLSLFSKG